MAVAIAVARHQSEVAIKLQKSNECAQQKRWSEEVNNANTERLRRYQAVIALAERLRKIAKSLESECQVPDERDPIGWARLSSRLEDLVLVVGMLKTVDVIDIGSYDAASAIVSLISAGEEMMHCWHKAESSVDKDRAEWLYLLEHASKRTAGSYVLLCGALGEPHNSGLA